MWLSRTSLSFARSYNVDRLGLARDALFLATKCIYILCTSRRVAIQDLFIQFPGGIMLRQLKRALGVLDLQINCGSRGAYDSVVLGFFMEVNQLEEHCFPMIKCCFPMIKCY